MTAFTHRLRHSLFAQYRWIPWIVFACFFFVVLVNGGLIYFAAESWPGLTTDHAYNEGIAYNRVIDESDKEANLGWSVAIAYSAAAKQKGRIVVTIRDRQQQPLEGLTVMGEAERPIDKAPPIKIALTDIGGGQYAGDLTVPLSGQWEIFLIARRGDDIVRTGKRIMVP